MTYNRCQDRLGSIFLQRKKRILAGLLGIGEDIRPDKSLKGSVDAPLAELIEAINQNDRFVSTSCCSGRFSVFLENVSGRKNEGRLLYASHEPVDANIDGSWLIDEIRTQFNKCCITCYDKYKETPGLLAQSSLDFVDAATDASVDDKSLLVSSRGLSGLPDTNNNDHIKATLWLNVEPFVIHMECNDLDSATMVLDIARQSGLKESGILSLSKRIVVAIRGSRKYYVPIGKQFGKRLEILIHNNYMSTLLQLGNVQLVKNFDQLARFQSSLIPQLLAMTSCKKISQFQSSPTPEFHYSRKYIRNQLTQSAELNSDFWIVVKNQRDIKSIKFLLEKAALFDRTRKIVFLNHTSSSSIDASIPMESAAIVPVICQFSLDNLRDRVMENVGKPNKRLEKDKAQKKMRTQSQLDDKNKQLVNYYEKEMSGPSSPYTTTLEYKKTDLCALNGDEVNAKGIKCKDAFDNDLRVDSHGSFYFKSNSINIDSNTAAAAAADDDNLPSFVKLSKDHIEKVTGQHTSTKVETGGFMLQQLVSEFLNQNQDVSIQDVSVPTKWERLGNAILFPEGSFKELLNLPQIDVLWKQICQRLSCDSIGIQSRIFGEKRESQARPLFGDSFVVRHKENGVVYILDVLTSMFASGNGTERMRIPDCVQMQHSLGQFNEPETVVDMYCGIGYFSLPLLVKCRSDLISQLWACDWNQNALEYFRKAIPLNGIDSTRVQILSGDNRLLGTIEGPDRGQLANKAHRVCLGLIPECVEGWRAAVRLVRNEGTILHIHGLEVKQKEKEKTHREFSMRVLSQIRSFFHTERDAQENSDQASRLEGSASDFTQLESPLGSCDQFCKKIDVETFDSNVNEAMTWKVDVVGSYTVKSFSPKLDHLVVDLFCRRTRIH